MTCPSIFEKIKSVPSVLDIKQLELFHQKHFSDRFELALNILSILLRRSLLPMPCPKFSLVGYIKGFHGGIFKIQTAQCIILTCCSEHGDNFFSLSFPIVSISSRKSVFVPTKITGVDGQWCFTSGNHFPRTFSKDAGDTTKQLLFMFIYK